MNKILAVTLIVFATCPAVAETSIVGDVSPPEVIEGAAPRVAPLKTWVPGHQSQHGGWIAPYEKEGGPLPLAPGRKPQGYVPGYHDAQGGWVPGHPE